MTRQLHPAGAIRQDIQVCPQRIFLVNFLNEFYFILQCPGDTYIIDGYPCNQTKTVSEPRVYHYLAF